MSKVKCKLLTVKKNGFTLIETLIYIAIIGGVIASFISYSVSISNSRNKNYVVQEVQANLRFCQDIIKQKIREADGVNIASSVFDSDPGILSLSMEDSSKNPTVIHLNNENGILQISEGLNPPINLSSSKVKISNLVFEKYKHQKGKENISINLEIEYDNFSNDKNFNFSQNIRFGETLRQ